MDRPTESQLAECYQLLAETGSIELCLERFPHLREEILAHWALINDLASIAPSQPARQVTASGRRLLLSSLESNSAVEETFMPWKHLLRFAGPVLGLLLLGGVALAAGAASGPGGSGGAVGDFLSAVGLQGSENSLPEGSPRPENGHKKGLSLLEATGTVEPTVTGTVTPGPTGTVTPVATGTVTPVATGTVTPAATGTVKPTGTVSATTTASAGAKPSATGTPSNHGQAVSQAVHEAQANGDPVGPAACKAAHDASTLPENAQNAPGHDKDKECAKGHEEADEEDEGDTDDTDTPDTGSTPSPTPAVTTASGSGGSNGRGGRDKGDDQPKGNGNGNGQSGGATNSANQPAHGNGNGNGNGGAGGNTNNLQQPGNGNRGGNGNGNTQTGGNGNGNGRGNGGGQGSGAGPGNPGRGKR